MRNLSFCGVKWDKKYALAFIIALICSFICGIVLCNFINYSTSLLNLADDYVYYVFNFKNGNIIFPHLLGDMLYFYIFFLISYFTKFKYLNLIFVFFKGALFRSLYGADNLGRRFRRGNGNYLCVRARNAYISCRMLFHRRILHKGR